MDEKPTSDGNGTEEPQPAAEIKETPEVEEPRSPTEIEEMPEGEAPPAPDEVVLEGLASGKESWKGSGCSTRVKLYGCLIGMVLLIAALLVGTSMMRRMVWVNMGLGQQAVVKFLPRDLPAAERQRTIQNLDRFRAVLEASDDPYDEMGEFMNRVREMVEDRKLTAEELEEFNSYLERVIEESGIPLMQLGAGIRNSEFGIRNSLTPEAGGKNWRRVLQGPPRLRYGLASDLGALKGTLAGRKRPAYSSQSLEPRASSLGPQSA
jgi:hypothetical protein